MQSEIENINMVIISDIVQKSIDETIICLTLHVDSLVIEWSLQD